MGDEKEEQLKNKLERTLQIKLETVDKSVL
jgi:hypothetical protein